MTAVKRRTDGESWGNDGLCSTDTRQQFYFPKREQDMGHRVTKEIQNLNFLFTEKTPTEKVAAKTNQLLLADAIVQLRSCTHSQHSAVSAQVYTVQKALFSNKYITPE